MTVHDLYRSRAASQPLDAMFRRLQCLQGSDPGFYVLAVHSFMEGILRTLELSDETIDDSSTETFGKFLRAFKSKLIQDAGGGFVAGLDFIHPALLQHQLTNDVRHLFASAQTDEARVATQHLRRFCEVSGIPKEKGLDGVLGCLKAWEERASISEISEELKRTREKLKTETRNATAMAGKLAEYEAALKAAGHFREEIRIKDRAIEELKASRERKDVKFDELRAERARLAVELKKATASSAGMDDARFYMEALSRLSILSRTRADYEKTVVRLTPEQKRVLSSIRLDADFLVKGSAGTGKTLVLLKAIEKARGRGTQADLELPELSGSVALLTYTATLVKYDAYLSAIMAGGSGADRIMTADAFLRERLAAIEPGVVIDYDRIKALAETCAPSCLKPVDLVAEAESFIWAYDLSRKTYVDDMIERVGMKKPLQRAERALVWAACEAMAALMDADSTYSRSYSRTKILRVLAANPEDPRIERVDYIFIDEAQDLCAIDLKVLKACARKALVMAGDADQSIYQPGFSFRKAGIDIAGRSRILRTNFRNTLPIHGLAERYRALDAGMDAENSPDAFRDGPEPEHFTGKDRNELLDLIAERVELLTRRLGYDPENICVLAPSADDVQLLIVRLAESGHTAEDIREKNFDFARPGSLRVSTFHSSKGLDFPVILMLLCRPPYTGSGFDDAVHDRMTRNLIYVAATRAMDQLCVFTLEDPSSAAIGDLVGCFGDGAGDDDGAGESAGTKAGSVQA
jgi:hypothetical protein